MFLTTTIAQAIDNIRKGRYLLPSIQRDVVWDHEQIESLFDSLMRDYPIGTFLFWRVDKEYVNNYRFYKFLDYYHEINHKDLEKVQGKILEDIIGVLDGQQRLTALNIGLGGTYAFKTPWRRWDNPAAFPIRNLYLDLRAGDGREDMDYDFRFLTIDEVKDATQEQHWYKVGDILNQPTLSYVLEYIKDNGLDNVNQNVKKKPLDILATLSAVVHSKPIINYYLETSEDLDKVLNIFIRVNSGGTQLSYSDLLLSIASASWKKTDARDEISTLLNEINQMGATFNFNKDVILKACLVLCDFQNIEYNINNFNRKNMLAIEAQWSTISAAIRTAVRILSDMGINRDRLPANNAIIPIAYYVLKRNLTDKYIKDIKELNDRRSIQKWLSLCMLKRIFGSHADSVLVSMRDEIRKHVVEKNKQSFPLDEIKNSLKGNPTKSIIFTDDDIENLFTYSYGGQYTFFALSLLYPWLDYSNAFQLDHMHPRSKFVKSEFNKMKLTNQQIDFYNSHMNNIANLELIQTNQQKSDKPLEDFISDVCKTKQDRNKYFKDHYIDTSSKLSFDHFQDFIEKRKSLMKAEYERLLK